MSLTDLEQHLLAHYVTGAANDLNIAGRFYPYSELIFIIEDKIQVATRKFGRKVTAKAKTVAQAFLDRMIEQGAFSTKTNDFGGTMHQFQAAAYKEALREMQAADPIAQQAAVGGDAFWQGAFTSLAN